MGERQTATGSAKPTHYRFCPPTGPARRRCLGLMHVGPLVLAQQRERAARRAQHTARSGVDPISRPPDPPLSSVRQSGYRAISSMSHQSGLFELISQVVTCPSARCTSCTYSGYVKRHVALGGRRSATVGSDRLLSALLSLSLSIFTHGNRRDVET